MALPTAQPQYENTDQLSEGNQAVDTETQPPPVTPPEKKKPNIGIILLIIYGIVLYGAVGYSIYTKNALKRTSQTKQSTPTGIPLPQFVESSEKKSSDSFELVASTTINTLPLSTMPAMEASFSMTPYTYLNPINVRISNDVAQKVSAYQIGHLIFVGPKAWYGSATVRDNGLTAVIQIAEKNNANAPYMKIYIAPKGHTLGLIVGSQYFQWIRDHASELQIQNDLLPIVPMTSGSAVNKHLITFSDTASLGPKLETYAVAFSDADAHLQDKQWTMVYMEITLPKEERQFAQELVDIFIRQYNLANK